MTPASTGTVLVVGAAMLWASIGLQAQPLLDRGVEPATIAFGRALVGGVLFLAQARGRWPSQGRPTLVGFGVVGVGVFYLALPAAIDAGGVSLAWLLLYTAPAWVALGAPFLLGERLDRRTGALVAVTVVGVALVALGGGEGVVASPGALGWGLLAGLSYASWYFATQRAGTGPVATGAVALPVGALVLAPFARWPGGDPTTWLLLASLGVCSTWLPALAWYRGIRHLPAARAAVLATIEPVAAMALAWVLLGERLAPVAVGGAVLVVAAALAAARGGRRPRGRSLGLSSSDGPDLT